MTLADAPPQPPALSPVPVRMAALGTPQAAAPRDPSPGPPAAALS